MSATQPEPVNIGTRRVALVHDWLTGMRGGEKVLEALYDLVPDAQLFTLLHVRGTVSERLEAAAASTSLIQWLPWTAQHYRRYVPLFPWVIEQFDMDHFDLVISTSHCAAKAVVPTGRARHLCYCHTPMRYAWDQFTAYFGSDRVGPLRSRLYQLVFRRLARWDASTAGRVSRYVANSQHVAARIRRYYNRAATVVYPPVDTSYFSPSGSAPGPYYLIVSALVPYKRVEVAIAACNRTHTPLKIVGDGPERERLEAQAGPNVEFLGTCADEKIRELYRGAKGFILPGEEDFGIAPVEALACGRPVIGLARGGATETVEDGRTGVLVDQLTPDAFAEGINRADGLSFDSGDIRKQALRFSRSRFQDAMRRCIEETVHSPRTDPTW
jgi:glycosyltransferase involved in cell wall biosynthesis